MVAGDNSVSVASSGSEFVSRVSSLPTVEAALGMAVSSYNRLKEASPATIKSVMEVGEKTTNMALGASQPLLEKLQGPISFVDSLACQGLDRVEERVPAVKEAPEKILADVKEFSSSRVTAVRDSVVGYGTEKLQQIGLGAVVPTPEKIVEYREQLVSYAAVALAAAEGALDSHLQSAGAQVPAELGSQPSPGDIRARVEHVTAKARLCVSYHTTERFVAAQKAASDGVSRVVEALSVIRALKDSVREGHSVQDIAKELHFDWLSTLLEQAKDKPASQQALFVAQAAAREAQEALARAQEGVKSRLTDSFASVVTRATELTTALQGASVAQLSTQVVSTLTQQAQQLQTLIQQLTGLNLTQYLPEIKALSGKDAEQQKNAASETTKTQ